MLLDCLQKMVVRAGGHESSRLKAVMEIDKFAWVATYVVTDSGQMIFKEWRTKKHGRMEAFGGAESPHANMINAMCHRAISIWFLIEFDLIKTVKTLIITTFITSVSFNWQIIFS